MLLCHAGRTVEELAQALDLTDNGVRAHLTTLERDGIVRQRGSLARRRPGWCGQSPSPAPGRPPRAGTAPRRRRQEPQAGPFRRRTRLRPAPRPGYPKGGRSRREPGRSRCSRASVPARRFRGRRSRGRSYRRLSGWQAGCHRTPQSAPGSCARAAPRGRLSRTPARPGSHLELSYRLLREALVGGPLDEPGQLLYLRHGPTPQRRRCARDAAGSFRAPPAC
jgi:DNA-binding transcriptional ArsR family regulator